MNYSRNVLTGLLLLCLVATWSYHFYSKNNCNQHIPVSSKKSEILSEQKTIIHSANADSSLLAAKDSLIKVVKNLNVQIDSLETKNHRLKRLIKYGE
jgi:hypothetical protein